jgi:tetratricopeptide (TPR) repeat protein
LIGRSNAFVALVRFEAALADLDAALLGPPALPEARLMRGVVVGSLGRHGEAAAAFAQALEERPDWVQAL